MSNLAFPPMVTVLKCHVLNQLLDKLIPLKSVKEGPFSKEETLKQEILD